jgi:hypothetical protein
MIAKSFHQAKSFHTYSLKTLRETKSLRDHAAPRTRAIMKYPACQGRASAPDMPDPDVSSHGAP